MIIEYEPALSEIDLIRKSGELYEEIRKWAPKLDGDIGDVVAKMVYVTKEGTPPAWFLPHKRLLHINAALIDVESRPDVVTGAVLHELGHALYSHDELFSGWGVDPAVRSLAVLFEEVRIENELLRHIKADDLRPMHSWLIGSMLSSKLPEKKLALSKLWALIYGRVLAGVYSGGEAKELDEIVRVELGDYRVDTMCEILAEAIEVDFSHPLSAAEQMFDCARRWIDLFKDDEGEDDEEEDSVSIGGVVICSHADADEEDFEDGESPIALPEDVYIVLGSGEFSSVDAPENSDLLPDTSGLLAKALSKMADDVASPFLTEKKQVRTSVPAEALADLRSRSTRRCRELPPSPNLRMVSQRLAGALRRLALPTVSRVRVTQEAPPGRLNGRGAVQRSADRAAGRISTARPWRGTKKSVTVAKPVRVGVMTDISGSMGWAEMVVAEFAWAVNRAGSSIGAASAAITYGDNIYAVALPRETLKSVRKYPAVGSTEAFDRGAAAMEALLRLGEYDGASKVLFNVSDGHYVIRDEYLRARTWLKRWTEAGTVVIWIGCEESNKRHYEMPGVIFVNAVSDVEQMINSLMTTLGNIK